VDDLGSRKKGLVAICSEEAERIDPIGEKSVLPALRKK